MKLLGVDYGCVINAPGARGFYGEGFPYHKLWRYLGMDWDGVTFAAKTMTLHPRLGNMPLRNDGLTPQELLCPRCIVVKPLSGHVLNAVGLANPGAVFLLDPPKPFRHTRWQERSEPFFLNFMAVAGTPEKRLTETQEFVDLLWRYLPFPVPFALQLNFGCPNVKHRRAGVEEIWNQLDVTSVLTKEYKIPLVPNFSVATPHKILLETAKHPACTALWVANTVPWGHPNIDWKWLFDTNISPLIQFDGGGLSGPHCFSLALMKLISLRDAGVQIPIVVGNGIQTEEQVSAAFNAGADAITLGIISLVRPWRMRRIIKAAYNAQT
jgi:dihydroorotate dehydrogenase